MDDPVSYKLMAFWVGERKVGCSHSNCRRCRSLRYSASVQYIQILDSQSKLTLTFDHYHQKKGRVLPHHTPGGTECKEVGAEDEYFLPLPWHQEPLESNEILEERELFFLSFHWLQTQCKDIEHFPLFSILQREQGDLSVICPKYTLPNMNKAILFYTFIVVNRPY